MQAFKKRWEITKNWQLLFPLLGIIALIYSSYRLSNLIIKNQPLYFKIALTIIVSYLLLNICLKLFKKLEHKWVVKQRWEIIRIFLVFAITGSSSLFVGRPIIKSIGITKENLNIVVYYILFCFIALVFYQILLVTFGWLFGQFEFFWNFEKKMLRRFGLGRFLKN
ncbi:DUF6787 family protein [Aurantibacter sp.]|uniref:DUF6787 family protein n=1 Tax=Aurantibacter sp. TaxID=2807103 RepID=UPI0035C85728